MTEMKWGRANQQHPFCVWDVVVNSANAQARLSGAGPVSVSVSMQSERDKRDRGYKTRCSDTALKRDS